MMEKRENASNKEREKRQLPEEIDDIEMERKPRDRSSIAINNGLSFFVYNREKPNHATRRNPALMTRLFDMAVSARDSV
jgi:hypothetical protein